MGKNNSERLIIYELNEVPPKLLNYFIKINPNSNLAKLTKKSEYFITYTKDDGELHPWSTWPTVHRGVNNYIHNIRFINQDLSLSKDYPPIWEILLNNNKKIGIFGSLQSYPPLKGSNVSFYVPDTFAPSAECFPSELNDFQDFNLKLVSGNKAIQKPLSYANALSFVKLILNGTISIKSSFKTFLHVIKEIINSEYKKRRSIIQPILGFELYFKLVKKSKPEFTTFFTNHVAGMMHRYWKDLFPEDFNSTKNKKSIHSKSIIKAMEIADKQIGKIYDLATQNNMNFWVLSSMGQAAIDRGEYIEELFLESFEDLINSLELNAEEYELQLAMQPDICIACKTKKSLQNLINSVKTLKDLDGNLILKKIYEPVGLKLNLSINRSKTLNKTNSIKFKNYSPCDISKFGFSHISRDIGTGYHIPEGIFIAYGDYSKKIFHFLDKSKKIDTTKIYNIILDLYKISPNKKKELDSKKFY